MRNAHPQNCLARKKVTDGSKLIPSVTTSRVLCVGIATLDIVNQVEGYPAENSEVRALSQTQRMGGNAANTAIVLSQLGVNTSWAGNLPASSGLVEQTFSHYGVDYALAMRLPGAVLPTSYITLNRDNGSRSIVHYRDAPEYAFEAFSRIDLRRFDWLHFEGRAVGQLTRMLLYARDLPWLRISLEVEKPRPGIEDLFERADLLFFSHDYARARGYKDAPALLLGLKKGQVATCTWGSEGAWGIDHDGRLLQACAPNLPAVVDTIGAGDVFNAAMISGLCRDETWPAALQAAVNLASLKCGKDGLDLDQPVLVSPLIE